MESTFAPSSGFEIFLVYISLGDTGVSHRVAHGAMRMSRERSTSGGRVGRQGYTALSFMKETTTLLGREIIHKNAIM